MIFRSSPRVVINDHREGVLYEEKLPKWLPPTLVALFITLLLLHPAPSRGLPALTIAAFTLYRLMKAWEAHDRGVPFMKISNREQPSPLLVQVLLQEGLLKPFQASSAALWHRDLTKLAEDDSLLLITKGDLHSRRRVAKLVEATEDQAQAERELMLAKAWC